MVPDILIPSPGKPFDVGNDNDNDDHYSVNSKRHKSGASGLIDGECGYIFQ